MVALSLSISFANGGTAHFTDVSSAAGIHFVHHSGATGKRYLPESLGAGCAFVDLDNDGWPDIVLLNGKDWSPVKGQRYTAALYRNNRNGTFTDITKGSGLDIEIYGLGVAAGDYDNDGLPDLYITALEGDHLFHNLGNSKFADVTAAANIHNADFGTSAAWFDYDRDGKLDLVVGNYVVWSAATDVRCSMDGKTKSYCTPETYKGRAMKLYHNLGGGKFADVTTKAGLGDPTSKSLGITVVDYNNDGWPDLFVANDTQPNKLYRNGKDGTFHEEGVPLGVAYSEDGTARGGMGTDAADLRHSGNFDLVVGNFSGQMTAVYQNNGSGLLTETAANGPIGRATLQSLTFGAFFFDFDLDGWTDLFVGNGHLEPEIQRFQPNLRYKQPPLLFRNREGKGFEDVSAAMGPDFAKPLVARGATYADFDHDGDLDILIATNNGSAVLLRNDLSGKNANWLTVHLTPKKGNRSGIGATVAVESALGRQMQTVHSGSSYCSQSDLTLTFGLGADGVAKKISVTWLGGSVMPTVLTNVPANRRLTIDENGAAR